jgi:tetratricopeptide (TPR) repeat protein
LSNLGAILLAAGDEERAGPLLHEAVALAREVGDTRIAALAINNLGDLALTQGDYARAEPLFEESLALLRERGDTANVARSLFNLGAVALMLDRPAVARDRFREALALGQEAGDREDLAWCLLGIAGLDAAGGDGDRAAMLLGAAVAVLDAMGAALKPFERRLHDSTAERARQLCGDDAFEDARRRGASLAFDEAIELATAALTD